MSRELHAEITNVLSSAELNRRDMMARSLAVGFALAVQPVSAATLTTSAGGLTEGEVHIPVGEQKIPGYRAMPKSGGPFPVVLVVQEIFGVHEHIKDVCRRFAHLGYLAIAPELYARQGDVSKLSSIDDVRAIVGQVPDVQVMSDLDATVEFAKESGKGDITRLGITGFCWGGRIVWLYAAHNERLKAGVAWYGRLTGAASDNTPRHPVDIAGLLNAPVLGLYAGEDQGIPDTAVAQMRTALAAAKDLSEIIVYPDAHHGFHADYRPTYSEADAKDGWQKLLAWFKKHGVA